MARRGGGGKSGNDNFLAIIAGGVAATLLDFFLLSNKIQGINTKIGTVSKVNGARKVPITMSDYGQFMLSTILGMYGFTRAGTSSRIPAFAYGMAITQILTKFVFPTTGIARYVIYDIDDNGNLTTSLGR